MTSQKPTEPTKDSEKLSSVPTETSKIRKTIDVQRPTQDTSATYKIRRICSLSRVGVFSNYTCSSEVPIFRKYNLIYGFNGSGKTTLSRVFCSLRDALLHPELPDECEFLIELSDGSKVKHLTDHPTLRERLNIFNVDFVESNVQWKAGTASPIYYIGKEQAEAAKRLEALQQELQGTVQKLQKAREVLKREESALSLYRRDIAKDIETKLKKTRGYTAANLTRDYSQSLSDDSLLTEQEYNRLALLIQQDEPLPKLARSDFDPHTVSKGLASVAALLEKSLGQIVVESLQAHAPMLSWVKEGLTYHQNQALADCLFCGNPLSTSRIDTLKAAIDDRYERLVEEVTAASTRLEDLLRTLRQALNSVPQLTSLSKDLRTGCRTIYERLNAKLDEGEHALYSARELVRRKATAPNVAVPANELPSATELRDWEAQVSDLLREMDAVIQIHNRAHDSFQADRLNAFETIKAHCLKVNEESYRLNTGNFDSAKADVDKLTIEQSTQLEQVNELKKQVRSHGAACDDVNQCLHAYLGHKELDFAPSDEGYLLRRNGKEISGAVSEGEKTAIALSYFLSSLKADGRKLKDQIVVIDDPISSLDSKALNYSFWVIRKALSEAGQLILLTHNMSFMNEAKKWLKNGTESAKQKQGKEADTATSCMLFLDVTQEPQTGRRTCSIKAMPTYLREYESEYHYFFSLMCRFKNSTDSQNEYLYLMPNVLRKVLEVFLTFKFPGSAGFESKIENLAKRPDLIDEPRLLALGGLVSKESHSDSVEDLVTFSPMTVEETRNAADALCELMSKMDPEHFNQMQRICDGRRSAS